MGVQGTGSGGGRRAGKVAALGSSHAMRARVLTRHPHRSASCPARVELAYLLALSSCRSGLQLSRSQSQGAQLLVAPSVIARRANIPQNLQNNLELSRLSGGGGTRVSTTTHAMPKGKREGRGLRRDLCCLLLLGCGSSARSSLKSTADPGPPGRRACRNLASAPIAHSRRTPTPPAAADQRQPPRRAACDNNKECSRWPMLAPASTTASA